MNPENALTIWARACKDTGLRWYLYKETLLCAAGYGSFPQTLDCAQIAVLGREFQALQEQVFPGLPDDWTLNKKNFGRGTRQLAFWKDGAPVLEICVLCAVDTAEGIGLLNDRARQICQRLNKRMTWNKLGRLLLKGIYTGTLGRPVQKQIGRLTEQAYGRLTALVSAETESAAYYCDCLTAKHPVLLPEELLREQTELLCQNTVYPVFAGYRNYLSQAFGDYENGLTDAVGCGLTAEDKAELANHQARCFEALTFLQEVSREFGLRYYLLAGSVLGAVRHGGFIPWDDDIDVGIRVEELAEFEQILARELPLRLPGEFTLMRSGANDPYPRMFSKICCKGRCCIDLWPLVPTYTDGLRAKLQWYTGKLITKVHYGKIGHPVRKYAKPAKLAGAFLTDRGTMALARYNERRYANRNTPAYINLYSIYRRPKEIILRRWLDTPATALFNGLEVPVVGCTQEYLTHLYGDYMRFPAPWKRASRHVERFLVGGKGDGT